MRLIAALLLLWAPLGSGAATVRASLAAHAPAPVPALALPAAPAAAALVPAALAATPGLTAAAPPALSALAPVSVLVAAPAAAPALAAPALSGAALRPAAAGPGEDSGRVDGSGEAGRRRFDGAAARAPYDYDAPVVTGPEPQERRSSGLSPPTAGEVERAYRDDGPRSPLPDALRSMGVPLAPFAVEALRMWTFVGEAMFRARMSFFQAMAARELIGFSEHRDGRRFAGLLGRWLARQEAAEGREGGRHLPANPLGRGEYWDIASGMNAAGMIREELAPGSSYRFFDANPFVAAYLRETADLAGAANARVMEGDVNAIRAPAEPLAVLRVKNAAAYVPGFAGKLEEMARWIAPGGRLAIQNDPNPGQRMLIREKHGPLILRLLEEGWTLTYSFSRSPSSSFVLDTILLDRPSGEAVRRSPAEAAALWGGWLRASAYADER